MTDIIFSDYLQTLKCGRIVYNSLQLKLHTLIAWSLLVYKNFEL